MKKTAVAALFAFGLGGLSAFALLSPPAERAAPNRSAWTEVRWPFPVDEWGVGKSFRCTADTCGAEVTVHIRAKIGFCNCTTGVSDDDELDRLSDFRLMGDKSSVLGAGHEITVAWMKGRSRPYAVSGAHSALAIAFNNKCDALVATAVVASDQPAVAEPRIVEFLNSQTIVRWTEATLGL